MRRPLALLFVLASACAEGEGHICVDPAAAASFEEGDELTVHVVLESCISACARRVRTSCEVSVDGDTIHLDARGSYIKPSPLGACVALCADLTAECVVPDLPPGTYEIHAGDNMITLVLPATGPIRLASECGSVVDVEP
jgi:hypothetical protein